MLTNVLTLVKSKVALAALGVLVVGGSGSAVALAATGHLNMPGHQTAAAQGQQGQGDSGDHSNASNRGHAEGMLTKCANDSITVTDEQGAKHTFAVNSSTSFVGYIHGNDKGGSTSASKPSFTLTNLCKLVNKVKVQVQATASTSGKTTTYTATKITVEGPGTANPGSDAGDHSNAGDQSHGKPDGVPTPNSHSSSGISGSH